MTSHLEHARTQSDYRLRRCFSRSDSLNTSSAAADDYIAERELKRQSINDVLVHRRSQPDDEGMVEFAGTRIVRDETLVLLKRNGQMIVLPIDTIQLSQLKRLSIGNIITLMSKGIRIAKNRSR